MTLAEILCTCGKRFSVQDDGGGLPHACPDCQMLNVLPRVASLEPVGVGAGTETQVRSTRVLSRVGQSVQEAVKGLPEGSVLGPYRVISRIGKGGMGSVYEAVDDRLGQKVALKVLSPELTQRPDFVVRFHRESRSLAELSDPRIAKVYFNGAAEGLPFFAMEFVDGRNLEQILEEDGRMSSEQVLHLMSEAAIGLSAAADQGIIHRDVKPTNLLVDREGNLRIVDFGLAKSVDSESRLTVTGAVVGTPYYLSPEQGLGKPVDVRSDIYSLGATFYHLMTGKPPFDAESPVSIIMCHVSKAPELITERNSSIPEPLARVVMRCIAKSPERRYQDYDELLEDLEAVRQGEPVAAPPQEISAKKTGPSVVVMDELEEGVSVLRRASRIRRGFALAIDFAVLSLAWVAVIAIFEGRVAMHPLQVLLPLAYLYIAVGDGLGGRSPGKRFAHLRVALPDGTGPSLLAAAIRGLLCLPIIFIVALSRGAGPADAT
ncbi:MAG: protein kinase, partial [Planctomycetota bacterium]